MNVIENLEYSRVNDHSLQLDLYLPESDHPLPVVIWIHAGAWRMGNNKRTPAVPLLTDAGFAVASIRYRLSFEALFPAQIIDCKTAVRFLRAHATTYNLNPGKIGAWGASAGGHLSAMLGTSPHVAAFDTGTYLEQSSAVQAVCDWFGPTDFLQMDAHALPDSPFQHNDADSPESELVGGLIQENKDKVAAANPITYITTPKIPFLIMHGNHDLLVPHHQSVLLAEALQTVQANVEFLTVEGAGHGGEGFRTQAVRQTVLDFFKQHLQ